MSQFRENARDRTTQKTFAPKSQVVLRMYLHRYIALTLSSTSSNIPTEKVFSLLASCSDSLGQKESFLLSDAFNQNKVLESCTTFRNSGSEKGTVSGQLCPPQSFEASFLLKQPCNISSVSDVHSWMPMKLTFLSFLWFIVPGCKLVQYTRPAEGHICYDRLHPVMRAKFQLATQPGMRP